MFTLTIPASAAGLGFVWLSRACSGGESQLGALPLKVPAFLGPFVIFGIQLSMALTFYLGCIEVFGIPLPMKLTQLLGLYLVASISRACICGGNWLSGI